MSTQFFVAPSPLLPPCACPLPPPPLPPPPLPLPPLHTPQSSKTYVPKNREVMKPLELANGLPIPNIVTSSDGDYWRIVRGAWMKCFTSTNLKRVSRLCHNERLTGSSQEEFRHMQQYCNNTVSM